MCGIAGVVGTDALDRSAVVAAMCAAIVHRGPDDDGFHFDPGVALGMRRLAIVDVAHGKQPIANESGEVVTVFNGEIYNFRELRAELISRGHTLKTKGDTECIVHLYEEFGPSFVTHLRGMFALAVWDSKSRTLVLSRDRLGKKPLYVRDTGGQLWFGSELRSLLADPAFDRAIDPVALHHYLTLQYVPAPWSIFAGVKKLEPGHSLIWRDGVTTIEEYWRPKFDDSIATGTRDDDVDKLTDELRERIVESVRVRLISERPLGAFLSGGLDSSAIVAAMAELTGPGFPTFCIGFDDPEFDERPHARTVAEHFGTDHYDLALDPHIEELLPRLAAQFGEPFADSSAVPSYALAQLAREHVVVALNGDGGDEAFGGYRRYALMTSRANVVAGLPPVAAMARAAGSTLTKAAKLYPALARWGRAGTVLGESSPDLRYARVMTYFHPTQKDELYTQEFAAQVADDDTYDWFRAQLDRGPKFDPVNRLLAMDTSTYLPGDLLAKVDITTMAHSLEARSPFLDAELIEWAAALPGDLKVRGGETKWLMRRAVGPWLPPQIVARPKQGFGVPISAWFRGPLKPMLLDLLAPTVVADRGWFQPTAITALVDRHLAGEDHGPRLWALVMLELWAREVLDQ